jgi:hypothetical protein
MAAVDLARNQAEYMADSLLPGSQPHHYNNFFADGLQVSTGQEQG